MPAPREAASVVFESESTGARSLTVYGSHGGASVAVGDDCGVFLDGFIYNRDRLLGAVRPLGAESDAELIRRAYREMGNRVAELIEGFFALLIWDGRSNTLSCVRDALGVYPLFFAHKGASTLLSLSPEVLVRRGGVASTIDRASVAGWTLSGAIDVRHTFYAGVRRVPPGHLLEVDRLGSRTRRHWEPERLAINNRATYSRGEAVERFDELLDQAVDRCLDFGPAAVLLSGGVDSSSVAAAAAVRSRARGLPDPLALSLVFPAAADEESVQRAVAADLGLPHTVVPLTKAAGPKGILESGLEMSASNWLPCINPWEASYNFLLRDAKRRGFAVVLTGEGGNDWLEVDWLLAADLLRTLDVAGLIELWRSEQSYFPRRPVALARAMLLGYGARPLARDAVSAALSRRAPRVLRAWRRRRASPNPSWAVPERGAREELVERWLASSSRTYTGEYYRRGRLRTLDGYHIATLMETGFTLRERLGAWRLNPYYDPDLVAFLCSVPPAILRVGGRAKGLAHASFERRVDGASAKYLRPVSADEVLASIVRLEGARALRRLGGTPMLSELGIVDAEQIRCAAEAGGSRAIRYNQVWQVLACEAWLQGRTIDGTEKDCTDTA